MTAAEEIVRTVRQNICEPCADPQKDQFQIDPNDPLNCLCRCERVESLLDSAAMILKGSN